MAALEVSRRRKEKPKKKKIKGRDSRRWEGEGKKKDGEVCGEGEGF